MKRLGSDARLDTGDGYFYFWSDEANDWLDKTVNVPTLSSLTLDEWVDEFVRLKKLNYEILQAPPKVTESNSRKTRRSKS